MRIQLPFLHRFEGRTSRNPEIRPLAAWDLAEVEVPELNFLSFDVGSRLGPDGLGTLSRDGKHWGFHNGSRFGTRMGDPIPKDTGNRFRFLMHEVAKNFYDEGQAEPADILSRTPDARMIEHSQRPRNVERLMDWASNSLAVVDNHLIVRLHEPSLTISIWNRPAGGLYAIGRLSKLKPWTSHLFNYGLHFSIDHKDEMQEFGRNLVTSGVCDEFNGLDLNQMTFFDSIKEDMIEQSVLSVAMGIINHRSKLTKGVSTLIQMTRRHHTQPVNYDHLLAAMHDMSGKLSPAERMMVELADEMWMDRPMPISEVLPSIAHHL